MVEKTSASVLAAAVAEATAALLDLPPAGETRLAELDARVLEALLDRLVEQATPDEVRLIERGDEWRVLSRAEPRRRYFRERGPAAALARALGKATVQRSTRLDDGRLAWRFEPAEEDGEEEAWTRATTR